MSDTNDDLEYEAGDINRAEAPVDENADDGDYEDGDINEMGAGSGAAERTLRYLLDSVVDDKDAVFIDNSQDRDGRHVFNVHVAPDDVGKIIGRKGRVIQATRTLVRAAGSRENIRTNVEVDD